MGNLLKSFIYNVSVALAKAQMSRADLARALKVSPQSVARYLGGVNTPGLDKVEAIAEAIGVPAHTLLLPAEKVISDLKSASPSDELSQLATQLPPDEYQDLVTLAQNYIRHRQSPSARKKGTGQS